MEGINPVALVVQPSALKPRVFVGVASGLCTLTGGLVALRLWTNFTHLRKIHIDDYLSALAVVFLIWNSVMFSFLIYALNANPDDISIAYLTKLVGVGIAAGNTAMYSAKLPLLFLLMRTFGIQTWLRRSCLVLIVFGTLGGLVTLLYSSISCSPDLYKPTGPFLFKCITAVTNACIARSSISLADDVIIFILPIPIIAKLKIPLRRKIGLALVFATGLLAIAASALSVYFQTAQSNGSSTNFANALLVTVVESAVVNIVSCTPAVHLFWTRHARSLRDRLGLRTLVSSHTKSKLSESQSNLAGTATSNSDRILAQNHHYVELEERAGMGKKYPY